MSISEAVAAGGAIGAVSRHLVYVAVGHLLGTGFAYATLMVNVAGSFPMGILVATIALVRDTSIEMRLFLTTGILGAFTTFSSFSLDFAVFVRAPGFGLCALYTIASFALAGLRNGPVGSSARHRRGTSVAFGR